MDGNTSGDPERKAPEQELARQAAMIDLLEHLLDQYWGMAYQSQEHRPQLLPSEMPDQLPVDLPFPKGSRIVGSTLWARLTSIIFDCSLTREEVLQFYEEQLLSQGWTKPEMASGPTTSYDIPLIYPIYNGPTEHKFHLG